jgi:uncharacterized membrane protein (DUF441 family)
LLGGYLFLILILALGFFSNSKLLLIASSLLLLFKTFNFTYGLEILDKKGIRLGLLFLLLAVLAPIASGKLNLAELKNSYQSIPGVLALISGIIATQIVAMGIELLDINPGLVVAMLIGSIIGIVFFNGVPVGPLLASGLTAFFYRVYNLFF